MRHPQASTTPDEALVVGLRELKDRTGLSLAALAARTPYSKSAWHRYLSGGTPPPRQAVEALCRLAGADTEAVLTLWATAEPPPPGADAPGAAPEGSGPGRRLPSWLPLSLFALFGTVTAVAAAAVALSARPGTAPAAQTLPAVSRCHGRSCQGELPDATVCARDARTMSTVTDPAYTVRLRWSPACGTVWSEVRLRSPRAREVSVRAGRDVMSAGYPADDPAGDSSPMLSASSPRGVEACAEVAGGLACTGLDVEPEAQE
ncbi:XRE family transcriptional regulator [Streptomyces barringtoniae]|uniref:XRE family transcriptional regulator n=1 Tax=Streptomyces barringtoniae TaxID=2892029 RepID=UPI001E5D4DB8|nr:XRE family transcriptional regulator [Streptomyces barringtoniae]MCC5477573.1 XRE family transcriptional regulator [Streptomyces barringtoniae]